MPKDKIKNPKEAHILLRISPIEKEKILKESAKQNVTMTEYIMRRVFPEKYESVIKWEKELSQELQSA
jgi:cell division inhibitor SulA